MSLTMDSDKIIEFAKQNLTIVEISEYSKVFDRILAFIKKSTEGCNDSIINISDFASSKWDWNFACLDLIRVRWMNFELNELVNIMRYLKAFTINSIAFAVKSSTISSWTTSLQKIIKSSLIEGIGLVYYIADIYIEVIKTYDFQQILELIQPFVELAITIQVLQVIDMVYTRIFMRLQQLKFEGFDSWLFELASSQNNMNPIAREKLYDLYTIIKGEELPERIYFFRAKESEECKYPPNALQKVQKQFYKKKSQEKIRRQSSIVSNESCDVFVPLLGETEKVESINIDILAPLPQKVVKKAPGKSARPKAGKNLLKRLRKAAKDSPSQPSVKNKVISHNIPNKNH